MEVCVIYITFVIAGMALAGAKNRSVIGWMLIVLLFSPFAFLILLCLPSLPGTEPETGEKRCDMCAEFIKKDALICKHCHSKCLI